MRWWARFYGAVKALAQTRVRLLLAYGSLSFFSMLWWFAAATRSATPRSALLVGTVGLATSGLLIAWQVVRTRYGDDVDPQAVSGLASGMPRYAVLLSLLALAAMGLPPFGVFAGFMGLLLSAPFPSSGGLVITLLAWLAASWYIMQMVQRLLFGVRRAELRYADLLQSEFASLVILVLVLLAIGLAPATFFALTDEDGNTHRHGIVRMEQVKTRPDIETRRMELRGIVHLAGEVIAQYWPMRTFVHHNPLHSLEYLPFEETVRRGKQFMGGNGYLPSHQYRAYLKSGRIRLEDLDAALKPLVRDTQVLVGSHRLTHGEVLRACLTEGLCDPVVEPLEAELPDPSKELIDQLTAKLTGVLRTRDLRERIGNIVESDQAALGRWITLSHWCDDTLGTEIVRQINDQLIKWCEAFLDEGACGLAHAGEG